MARRRRSARCRRIAYRCVGRTELGFSERQFCDRPVSETARRIRAGTTGGPRLHDTFAGEPGRLLCFEGPGTRARTARSIGARHPCMVQMLLRRLGRSLAFEPAAGEDRAAGSHGGSMCRRGARARAVARCVIGAGARGSEQRCARAFRADTDPRSTVTRVRHRHASAMAATSDGTRRFRLVSLRRCSSARKARQGAARSWAH